MTLRWRGFEARAREKEKKKRDEGWRLKFAWLPIYIRQDKCWVWLEFYCRARKSVAYGCPPFWWETRTQFSLPGYPNFPCN